MNINKSPSRTGQIFHRLFRDVSKKIALEFGKKGIVDKEYARVLLKMAGYRNRMVHLYQKITPEEIYGILKIHLSDIDRFVSEIFRFLEDYKKVSATKEQE